MTEPELIWIGERHTERWFSLHPCVQFVLYGSQWAWDSNCFFFLFFRLVLVQRFQRCVVETFGLVWDGLLPRSLCELSRHRWEASKQFPCYQPSPCSPSDEEQEKVAVEEPTSSEARLLTPAALDGLVVFLLVVLVRLDVRQPPWTGPRVETWRWISRFERRQKLEPKPPFQANARRERQGQVQRQRRPAQAFVV